MLSKLHLHKQINGDSNGASASEAILKLHGLIPEDDFPFQFAGPNQFREFENLGLLSQYGILSEVHSYSPLEAVNLVKAETDQFRFPLVSLPVVKRWRTPYCHIYVCGRDAEDLIMVDPVPIGGMVIAKGETDLRILLANSVEKFPSSQGIRVLTYRMTSSSGDS